MSDLKFALKNEWMNEIASMNLMRHYDKNFPVQILYP